MSDKRKVYSVLSDVIVNDKTEEKNGLTYLSWSFAWGFLLKNYPDSTYKVYENENGWNYFTDGKTCWVKTGVKVEGIEMIEYLPVMDYRNKSITVDDVTSTDVNKAIQRSLTKAIARHGLGLYVYAGEDLPESKKKEVEEAVAGIVKNIKEEIDACETLEELSLLSESKEFKAETDKLKGNDLKDVRLYYGKHNKVLKDNFEKDGYATQFNDSIGS